MQEFGHWRSIVLVFQTLGVVFGDVGTSQLYTFSVMFDKAPIKEKEDVLGALSLVLYTLVLIPLIKYVLVVLWANDDGEGIAFCHLLNLLHLLIDFVSSFLVLLPSTNLNLFLSFGL